MVAVEELAGERPRHNPTWSGQDEHCTLSAGGSSRRRRGIAGQKMKEAVEELAGERPRPTILMTASCYIGRLPDLIYSDAGYVAATR